MSISHASVILWSVDSGLRSSNRIAVLGVCGKIFICQAYTVEGVAASWATMEGEKLQLGIIDYGSGNTGSVVNAFARLGQAALLSSDVDQLASCTHLVLPGVGSFPAAREKLDKVLPSSILKELALSSRAFLGICVGMQLLCESGDEDGFTEGYGFFSGKVSSIPQASVLPHMGWNNLESIDGDNAILQGISESADFYFVHSYCLVGEDDSQIAARAEYGYLFPAVVRNNNVFGVQFHPEKSAGAGAKLLSNFLEI